MRRPTTTQRREPRDRARLRAAKGELFGSGPAARVLTVLAVLAMAPSAVDCQVGITFEFSFANPGARSMGFGGAFVALADDATAAFANPAGLVQLVDPEVSLEVRHSSYSIPFTLSGRLSGEPTGIGLDTEAGIRRQKVENDSTALSFVSFAYPRKRWSIAFYRHLLADFEISAETQGLFADGPGPLETFRLLERRDRTRLELVTYGLSAAFKIRDKLSLGLGLAYFDNVLQGQQDRYLWDEDFLEGHFGPSSFRPDRLVAESSFVAEGSDVALTAGLLWRVAESWSIGGFYRQGAEFELDFSIISGPANPDPETPPGSRVTISSPIEYPDVFGAGVAFRSSNARLTVGFEWDHIEYSSIFDSLGFTTSGELIADGDEYHLGAEYAFLTSRPVFALRAGLWHDPDHQVRSSLDSPILQGLIGPVNDQLHLALGFGAAFRIFQVDLGVDLSERRDALSISGIYSW